MVYLSSMLRRLISPSLLVAALLGAFSTYLAYQGKYEAALTGAGAAVAAGTAKKDRDDIDDGWQQQRIAEQKFLEKQADFYRRQYEDVKYEMNEREKLSQKTRDDLMQLLARAEDVRKYERETRREIEEIKLLVTDRLSRLPESKVKVEDIEFEIQKLENQKRQLLQQQDPKSLPASITEPIEPENQDYLQ
jgi:chromosome segregation ATPase